MSLQLTADLGFGDALARITRRVLRSIAFRQLVVISVAIFLVRFALNNVLRLLARWSSSPVPWDKSKLFFVMKEVYSPLEVLLFVAGCCTIADSFLPQLVGVPKATVNSVVRAVLSMSFVLGAATVVFNLKSRFCKEQAWQYEMQGNVTSQRRWEAYDKLGTFAIYTLTIILSIQAGDSVVLAIGGIGGLAIGLAGREICENLLNGFLLMTTMPFEVGEEVVFTPNGQTVEGIVLDVGWYRTTIRSFEREVFVIPNAVFSKNTVLNVTRKMREWRFYEFLCVRVQDVHKVNAIIQDIRRIVKNDGRILNKLHRRIFLDKITHHDVKIYLSFYVEASNRDAFMAVKQDLLLAFVDCVERNGARLATPRAVVSGGRPRFGSLGGRARARLRSACLLPQSQSHKCILSHTRTHNSHVVSPT
ncbi:MAG: Mechanosensitive ion channel-domain-containing protein [Monoraphidium minutum]|nr:MAG: Mechanosensitive ion channel-domain-containing protein [Monoraphidium minutum]